MGTVLYESEKSISNITLNRPDQYNAMNKEMLLELLDVIDKVEKNDDKIVIVSGSGNAFSAGGDISMMTEFADKDYYDEVMKTIESIVLKLYMMPKIVISAIKGAAVGLGLSLALTADYVIAENDSKLGLLFIGIGLVPDGGGHFWLRERIGTQKAKQFAWGMQQVVGPEAKSMGLIDIVTNDNALDEAKKLADKSLSSPVTAMLKTKMMYHARNQEELKYYLTNERKAQWDLRNTEDHQEGVNAFLNKRKPQFKGK